MWMLFFRISPWRINFKYCQRPNCNGTTAFRI